ncbi:hypothetical protein [Novipirellula artificiosorum]|uniref:hypothetical protein n=1 Tax=Novipirellula artificiosorum TaxID=2528016 RepID=UPI0011B4F844|nr:hypothetical protein [Novipirellula artificiosorum]
MNGTADALPDLSFDDGDDERTFDPFAWYLSKTIWGFRVVRPWVDLGISKKISKDEWLHVSPCDSRTTTKCDGGTAACVRQ